MTGLLENLTAKVPDPHARVYVLALLLEVHAGLVRFTPEQITAMTVERKRIALEEL